ncbi:MAG TPA: UPF0179 family protein [Methanomassiliicoccales archaeon]|nr:UPF0179 family protein [Methanomassiliicoccales archaeon]
MITVIGERQARVGGQFVYLGPLTECKECKLKGVCFNLDTGCLYRIVEVRDVKHDCKVHEDGVRVVRVEKEKMEGAVSKKGALEGTTITYEVIKCDHLGCEHYRLCHPLGIDKGRKARIARILGDLDCAEGKKLVMVAFE